MIVAVLLESRWLLALAWGALQFSLVSMWSWRRTRFWARAIGAGFVALPLLLIVSSVVVTPRERITRLCHDLAGFVEANNVAGVKERLTPDFRAEDLDRDGFIDRLTNVLTRVRVRDASLSRVGITLVSADVGVAEFQASASVRSPELLYEWMTSRWRLHLHRKGETWLVRSIERLSPAGPGIGDLVDWLR